MPPEIPEFLADFFTGKRLLCGFSGGADSFSLLILLHSLREKRQFSLQAVHFNHGLRGAESDADESFCREQCTASGIPLTVIRLNVPAASDSGEGVESAARRLRMEHWRTLASSGGPQTVVVLGHNSGDRIENVLLRLFRGSNSGGLSAMRALAEMGGITIARPLLDFSHAELEAFLREHGLTWRTDSTNLESEYGRNFLRNRLLPLAAEKFPYAAAGILQSARVLEEDADFLEKTAESELKSMADSGDFSPARWKSLHPAVLCRVLRNCAKPGTAGAFIPNHEFIARFGEMLRNLPESGVRRLDLPEFPGLAFFFSRERITLERFSPEADGVLWHLGERSGFELSGCRFSVRETVCGTIPETASAALFDAERFPREILLRVKRSGDRMIPFGGTVPVSLRKLYSDSKLPVYERATLPLFVDPVSGAILWIPGVRRSASAPAVPGRPALEFHFEKKLL